ncbi:MAG: hypothetical protein HQK66_01665 [Desulfamplus sp.]|nr:hypothetical protein [Desulfamplus sp.]
MKKKRNISPTLSPTYGDYIEGLGGMSRLKLLFFKFLKSYHNRDIYISGIIKYDVGKRPAKPLFSGSNPEAASIMSF